MKRGHFSASEKANLLERLRKVRASDPELSPRVLAQRFGLSHVTVRKLLREIGLYEPRSTAAERRTT
jgi:hypothetical protein